MSPGTIKNYLHLSQNMGDHEAFDPSQAALDWLREKQKGNVARKGTTIRMIFIFDEQEKPNQTKKIRAV